MFLHLRFPIFFKFMVLPHLNKTDCSQFFLRPSDCPFSKTSFLSQLVIRMKETNFAHPLQSEIPVEVTKQITIELEEKLHSKKRIHLVDLGNNLRELERRDLGLGSSRSSLKHAG